MRESCFKRGIAVATVVVFFWTSTGWSAVSSSRDFWSERRKAASSQAAAGQETAAPSRSSAAPTLAFLPRVAPQAASSFPGSAEQAASVSAPVRADPKAARLLGRSAERWPGWVRRLPLKDGSLLDIHLAEDPRAPVVIHIQDMHQNLPAQLSTARMIQSLAEPSGRSPPGGSPLLVGLEGAQGDFRLDPYRRYPFPKYRDAAAMHILQQGLIGGAEYAAVTGRQPLRLWGIEDNDLYLENIRAFRDLTHRQGAARACLKGLQEAADRLSGRMLAPALASLVSRARGFRRGEIPLAEYVPALLEGFDLPRGEFPNLARLHEAALLEKGLDFGEAERERAALVARLTGALSREALSRLMEQSLAYRAGRLSYGEFHRSLQAFCEEGGVSLSSFPTFGKYVRYVRLSEEVDANRLLQELSGAERRRFDRAAADPGQRTLAAAQLDLALIDKLLDQSLTSQEWSLYRARRRDPRAPLAGLPERLARLEGPAGKMDPSLLSHLEAFEKFYQLAERRNRDLVQRLLEQVPARDGTRKPAVLVAGGFHTPGVSALLKGKGVSYAVLAPRIDEAPSGRGQESLALLAKAPKDLEKLFSGEKLFLIFPRVPVEKPAAPEYERLAVRLAAGFAAAALAFMAGETDPEVMAAIVIPVPKWLEDLGVRLVEIVREKGRTLLRIRSDAGGATVRTGDDGRPEVRFEPGADPGDREEERQRLAAERKRETEGGRKPSWALSRRIIDFWAAGLPPVDLRNLTAGQRSANVQEVYMRWFLRLADEVGLEAAADVMEVMGVDQVWFPPFYHTPPPPYDDEGYAIADYRRYNAELIRRTGERNLRAILEAMEAPEAEDSRLLMRDFGYSFLRLVGDAREAGDGALLEAWGVDPEEADDIVQALEEGNIDVLTEVAESYGGSYLANVSGAAAAFREGDEAWQDTAWRVGVFRIDSVFRALRSRGIGVMVDVAFNHTSVGHEWFLRSANPLHEDHGRYADFYMWGRDPHQYAGRFPAESLYGPLEIRPRDFLKVIRLLKTGIFKEDEFEPGLLVWHVPSTESRGVAENLSWNLDQLDLERLGLAREDVNEFLIEFLRRHLEDPDSSDVRFPSADLTPSGRRIIEALASTGCLTWDEAAEAAGIGRLRGKAPDGFAERMAAAAVPLRRMRFDPRIFVGQWAATHRTARVIFDGLEPSNWAIHPLRSALRLTYYRALVEGRAAPPAGHDRNASIQELEAAIKAEYATAARWRDPRLTEEEAKRAAEAVFRERTGLPWGAALSELAPQRGRAGVEPGSLRMSEEEALPRLQRALASGYDIHGVFYFHRFYHHQADLNWGRFREDGAFVRNEDVYQAMMGEVVHLMGQAKATGFRLDAIPYLVKQEYTRCENLEPTVELARRDIAGTLTRDFGVTGMTEANQPIKDLARYLGQNGGNDLRGLAFPQMANLFIWVTAVHQAAAGRPVDEELLRAYPDALRELAAAGIDPSQLVMFLRNHDELSLEMMDPAVRRWMVELFAGRPGTTRHSVFVEVRGARIPISRKANSQGFAATLFEVCLMLAAGNAHGEFDRLSVEEWRRALSIYRSFLSIAASQPGMKITNSPDLAADLASTEMIVDLLERGEIGPGEVDVRLLGRGPIDAPKLLGLMLDDNSPVSLEARINRARLLYPEFLSGKDALLETESPGVLARLRRDGDRPRFLLLNNVGPEEASVTISPRALGLGGRWHDVLTEGSDEAKEWRFSGSEDAVVIPLPPYGILWLTPLPEAGEEAALDVARPAAVTHRRLNLPDPLSSLARRSAEGLGGAASWFRGTGRPLPAPLRPFLGLRGIGLVIVLAASVACALPAAELQDPLAAWTGRILIGGAGSLSLLALLLRGGAAGVKPPRSAAGEEEDPLIRSLKDRLYGNFTESGAIVAGRMDAGTGYGKNWQFDAAKALSIAVQDYRTGDPGARERIDAYLAFYRKHVQNDDWSMAYSDFLTDGRPAPRTKESSPQKCGPAITALALMEYAEAVMETEGDREFVEREIVPAVRRALDYIAKQKGHRRWGFDRWEEALGFHFHVDKLQRAALRRGMRFFEGLSIAYPEGAYGRAARVLGRRIWAYARGGGVIRAHLGRGRRMMIDKTPRVPRPFPKLSAWDSAVVFALLDAEEDEEGAIGPAADASLATVARIESHYLESFSLNRAHAASFSIPTYGLLLGRYAGDRYTGRGGAPDAFVENGGNGWPVISMAFARYYYRLAQDLYARGEIRVNETNKEFFAQRMPDMGLAPGRTVRMGDERFDRVIRRLIETGDGYAELIRVITGNFEVMSEQADKVTGEPAGATSFGWGYVETILALQEGRRVRREILPLLSEGPRRPFVVHSLAANSIDENKHPRLAALNWIPRLVLNFFGGAVAAHEAGHVLYAARAGLPLPGFSGLSLIEGKIYLEAGPPRAPPRELKRFLSAGAWANAIGAGSWAAAAILGYCLFHPADSSVLQFWLIYYPALSALSHLSAAAAELWPGRGEWNADAVQPFLDAAARRGMEEAADYYALAGHFLSQSRVVVDETNRRLFDALTPELGLTPGTVVPMIPHDPRFGYILLRLRGMGLGHEGLLAGEVRAAGPGADGRLLQRKRGELRRARAARGRLEAGLRARGLLKDDGEPEGLPDLLRRRVEFPQERAEAGEWVRRQVEERLSALPEGGEEAAVLRDIWEAALADPDNAILSAVTSLAAIGAGRPAVERLIDLAFYLGLDAANPWDSGLPVYDMLSYMSRELLGEDLSAYGPVVMTSDFRVPPLSGPGGAVAGLDRDGGLGPLYLKSEHERVLRGLEELALSRRPFGEIAREASGASNRFVEDVVRAALPAIWSELGVDPGSPAVVYLRHRSSIGSDADLFYWGPRRDEVNLRLAEIFFPLGIHLDMVTAVLQSNDIAAGRMAPEGYNYFFGGIPMEFNGASFERFVEENVRVDGDEVWRQMHPFLCESVDAVLSGEPLENVEAKRLIRAGTVLLFGLSREFGIPFAGPVDGFYAALREHMPAEEVRLISETMDLLDQWRNLQQVITRRRWTVPNPHLLRETARILARQGIPDLPGELRERFARIERMRESHFGPAERRDTGYDPNVMAGGRQEAGWREMAKFYARVAEDRRARLAREREGQPLLVMRGLSGAYKAAPRLTAFVLAPLIENLLVVGPIHLVFNVFPAQGVLPLLIAVILSASWSGIAANLLKDEHDSVFVGGSRDSRPALPWEKQKVRGFFLRLGLFSVMAYLLFSGAGLQALPQGGLAATAVQGPDVFIPVYLAGVFAHSVSNVVRWVRRTFLLLSGGDRDAGVAAPSPAAGSAPEAVPAVEKGHLGRFEMFFYRDGKAFRDARVRFERSLDPSVSLVRAFDLRLLDMPSSGTRSVLLKKMREEMREAYRLWRAADADKRVPIALLASRSRELDAIVLELLPQVQNDPDWRSAFRLQAGKDVGFDEAAGTMNYDVWRASLQSWPEVRGEVAVELFTTRFLGWVASRWSDFAREVLVAELTETGHARSYRPFTEAEIRALQEAEKSA